MSMLVVRDTHSSWYTPPPGQENRNIAVEAYETAVQHLKNELGIPLHGTIQPGKSASAKDIYAIVETARKKYEDGSKEHTGARKCLERLATRIIYYGKVLDTLAQHHPEYVALAWGAVKFVLTGVINRANLIQKLSQALVAIGEVLPRADLSAELYQTEYMEAALARLYTYIILFLTLCVKWYNRSPLGRFWSSLKSPFELDYQELVEQIQRCSGVVEDLANAGSRAEIRHVRVLAELNHNQSRELDTKLLNVLEVQERIEASMIQVLEVATSNKTITERMSGDVRGISGGIHRMELHLVIEFFKPDVLPEAALLRVQSLARREQSISLQNPRNLKVRNMIQNWFLKDGSSLLIVRVGLCARNQARELAAGMIEALKSSTQCVFWNVSGLCASKGADNMAELFKSLIFQVLQHSGGQFCNLAEQLNLSKVRDVHTDHEWIDLACLLFSRLPKAFVIIEAISLCKTHQHEPGWVNRFCGHLQTIVDRCSTEGNELKMLLVMYGNSYQVETKAANVVVTALQPTIPVPPRLQHMTYRSGLNAKGWRFPRSKVRTRS